MEPKIDEFMALARSNKISALNRQAHEEVKRLTRYTWRLDDIIAELGDSDDPFARGVELMARDLLAEIRADMERLGGTHDDHDDSSKEED